MTEQTESKTEKNAVEETVAEENAETSTEATVEASAEETAETTEETTSETAETTSEASAEEKAQPTANSISLRPAEDDDDDDYDDDDDDYDDDDDVDEYEDYEDEDDDEALTRRVDGPTAYVQRERGGRGRRVSGDIRPEDITYKNISLLSRFLDRRGRIMSRRKTRVNAKVQRRIVKAIKQARHLALLPYTGEHSRVVRKRGR